MKHRFNAVALVLLLMACGCAKTPFKKHALPRLVDPNPREIVRSFNARFPDHFTSENAVVLHIPFHDDLSMLGIIQVDRPGGSFEFVGLSQLGVQYFHLSGDRDGNHIRSSMPPLMKQKRILLSIAEDIRRAFLNSAPSDDAKATIRSRYVRFSEKSDDGTVLRTFGGAPPVLLEKRIKGFLRTKWRARYFEYSTKDDASYPGGIEVKNRRYFYSLTIRNRGWEPNTTSE